MFVSQDALSFMENCLAKTNIEVEIVVIGTSEKYEQFSKYLAPHHQENEFKPESDIDDRETAMIMFSSGTTGVPKGICLSHHSLLFECDEMIDLTWNKNFEKNLRVLLCFSNLYWISSLCFLICAMQSGYARVVCHHFDAAAVWKLIDEFKINLIFLPPYQAVEFLAQRTEDADASSLQVFLTGSCFVPEKLMKDLKKALPQTKILNSYGQTEMAGGIAIFDPSKPDELVMQENKPQSCGRIRKECEWKVVDLDTEKPLGPNHEGELRIKSHKVMNGYYKMDSSSAFDEEGYLKTGDIVRYDEENCFYIVDRIKEIFKYRGWHILPAMLEEVLLTHPAVKEAAVVAIPHKIDGDHPMGLVVLFEGHDDVTSEEIESFFNSKVADSQKLRQGVRIVEELEKTVTGKIKRRTLSRMVK
nr:4-coumarate--CoA ligase 1-like isoform X1 [Leptinotarsa decemlineata]